MCYSVVDRESFESVESFWISEIRKRCKKTPIILVATGRDIEDENGNASKYEDLNDNVSKQEGLNIMDKCGANYYVECSTHNQDEVNDLFEDVLLSVIKRRKRRRSSILRYLIAR